MIIDVGKLKSFPGDSRPVIFSDTIDPAKLGYADFWG
jgi:hypothetical protein